VIGIGTTHELLNRVALVYDTRDDITIPTRGMALTVYGGVSSRNVQLDDSLFTEAGGDGRFYYSPFESLVVATHVDLRYEPTASHVPFWALSSVGGDESTIGGSQTLRGYGTSRFYDRNSFSANTELRENVFSLNAFSTHIQLQVAPFFDTGRVFHSTGTWPMRHLHNVFGVGLRGIAPPSVVGYVDIGKGHEGVAVFTGIGYPF
jgi:outer membrane protein assembly factor BamA